ncbi:glycoside hydrolase 15-related [Catenulispora acidiphila DSM 44928]|uniref:Glycoside hydrolase 15-related n=1 Tax=Catenulispora acidiphila (strain DSM 44928 / JCM 14897 / NBRC 102108 / NRRL B-24433 / ID139908) TaxID=479433 RepID=C7Q1J0_CATAD|nr:glycoside hydrolase family 15 protein [Catenulispora acidiphila]ACU73719.1 glycoside hydrolase 15-related [Catenulispora acidiphila DSM 44928]
MVRSKALEAEPRFRPRVLRDYALLADGERGALIGPEGDIAWMCAPRWHSDAVFSTLIGGAGTYAVTPSDPRYVWGGAYEPGTLIWRSRWVSGDALIKCREALAFPGDPARAVLLRRVCARKGACRVSVLLEPRAAFGHYAGTNHLSRHDGVWTAHSGPLHWRWTGGWDAHTEGHTRLSGAILSLDLDIAEGGFHDLVLELSDAPLPRESPDPEALWQTTELAWKRSGSDTSDTIAPREADHAQAVLRGLTSGTGAMVAAATMALPEQEESPRSYDYRYAWIRDQCYAGIAAAAVGATDLLDRAVAFITDRLLQDGPRLRAAYTVTGAPVPDEYVLDLPGYPGGTDRVGNWVNQQFQLDVFGEVMQLLATAAGLDRLDRDAANALRVAVDIVGKHWDEPEAGIWELHDRRWTHSRLSCLAGLRRAAALPGAGRDLPHAAALADAILARTSQTCTHPDGYWQRAPDDPRPDASLLLPPVRGALPADDPRTVATLAAVRAQLTDEGYVYRYHHGGHPLGDTEGAFLLCGFTMALAEHQQGNEVRAMHYFERTRSACGPAGLFSEEYDPAQRQLRGNLPQAFVHAVFLECAASLGHQPSIR